MTRMALQLKGDMKSDLVGGAVLKETSKKGSRNWKGDRGEE